MATKSHKKVGGTSKHVYVPPPDHPAAALFNPAKVYAAGDLMITGTSTGGGESQHHLWLTRSGVAAGQPEPTLNAPGAWTLIDGWVPRGDGAEVGKTLTIKAQPTGFTDYYGAVDWESPHFIIPEFVESDPHKEGSLVLYNDKLYYAAHDVQTTTASPNVWTSHFGTGAPTGPGAIMVQKGPRTVVTVPIKSNNGAVHENLLKQQMSVPIAFGSFTATKPMRVQVKGTGDDRYLELWFMTGIDPTMEPPPFTDSGTVSGITVTHATTPGADPDWTEIDVGPPAASASVTAWKASDQYGPGSLVRHNDRLWYAEKGETGQYELTGQWTVRLVVVPPGLSWVEMHKAAEEFYPLHGGGTKPDTDGLLVYSPDPSGAKLRIVYKDAAGVDHEKDLKRQARFATMAFTHAGGTVTSHPIDRIDFSGSAPNSIIVRFPYRRVKDPDGGLTVLTDGLVITKITVTGSTEPGVDPEWHEVLEAPKPGQAELGDTLTVGRNNTLGWSKSYIFGGLISSTMGNGTVTMDEIKLAEDPDVAGRPYPEGAYLQVTKDTTTGANFPDIPNTAFVPGDWLYKDPRVGRWMKIPGGIK